MPKHTVLGDSAEIYQPRKKQSEKEKLREMPFKKRFAYLWEYYKIHAFVFIAVVALISYIIYLIVTPKVEAKFYAALINNSISEQVLTDYQKDFSEHLNLDPKTERVDFNSTFYFNEASDYNTRQVFSTYIAAQEIDVIIAPESEFESYAYYGYLDNLSHQLPTDLYSSMTDKFYISNTEADTNKSAYGIYLTETDLYKNNAINTDPYVLGIVVNSKQKENSVEFIRYLFQLFP